VLQSDVLLLGVDGGGTTCRARMTDARGTILGEGSAGPANIRFGLEASLVEVIAAANRCLEQAGARHAERRIVACLALAGAGDPVSAAAAQGVSHPFFDVMLTSDARAACVGAHAGHDGGIIIIGTGSIGWASIGGRDHRIGGWGFPISDEGSGAWLGYQALRRTLRAHDGMIGWTGLLRSTFARFDSDPHAIVRWMTTARPRDFAALAPLVVEHQLRQDCVADELMLRAAAHVDAMATRLLDLGAWRLALMGGLATHVAPLVSDATRQRLVSPAGDALSGALRLAHLRAERLAR
jgi:glucosamine kinase